MTAMPEFGKADAEGRGASASTDPQDGNSSSEFGNDSSTTGIGKDQPLIVILGRNGMLGNCLEKYARKQQIQVIGLDRQGLEVTEHLDLSTLGRTLDDIIPPESFKSHIVVVNCIGAIPQTRPTDRSLYFVNAMFPLMLSVVCEARCWTAIHVSTDCVFSGKTGFYNEDSIHDATSAYGISKSLGEASGFKMTVIRTSIIGEETGARRGLLEWLRSEEGHEVSGYVDHFWNGVTTLRLSEEIIRLILEGDFWTGVRHFHSPNVLSKLELLEIIKEVYELNVTIKPLVTGAPVDRSLGSIFSCGRVGTIRQQLRELHAFYCE